MKQQTKYEQNPNLNIPVVTTVHGDKEYRRYCRSIKGEYYVKDRDIYYHEETDTWYRRGSVKIDYDWESNCIYLKDTQKNLQVGVVDFDKDGKEIIGKFTINPYNNCQVNLPNGARKTAINPDILLEHDYFEDVANSLYHCSAAIDATSRNKMKQIRVGKSYTNKGYNAEDNKEEFQDKIKLFKEYPLRINEDAKTYGKFLGTATVGQEFECSVGAMPDYLQNRLGILSLRDGSLEGGPEWCTVPMTGAKCIQDTIEVCKELRKRNEIDIKCAYHIHFGTLPRERVFLVALYMLCYQIQDEVFTMWPGYKLDPRGIKRKNYCQKLQKMSIYPLKDTTKTGYEQFVNDMYTRIFEFLSDGHAADLDINRRTHKHPIDRKYERPSRYFFVNLQGMLFSPRETCEWRIASPTLNPQRAVNWMMMCNTVIKFCEYNMKKIITGEKITFKDVLNVYKEHWKEDKDAIFLSDYLIAYFQERKEAFAKDALKEDRLSEWELKTDAKYRFTYSGKSLFVN